MKTSTKSLVVVVLPLMLIVALFVALESEPAKNLGLDILFDAVFGVLFIPGWLYLLRKDWNKWGLGIKVFNVLVLIVLPISAINPIIDDWPRTPWVRVEAFDTVDAFLTDMKEQDYAGATVNFTPEMQKCVKPDDLNQPNTQPVQWKLDLWKLNERGNAATIPGTVTFSDGAELSSLFGMVWTDKQWQIDGFVFGMSPDERLDYLVVLCDE